MATDYLSGGTDLASIFAAYHSGWPQAAATGYKAAGADLNTLFAPLSTGSAAAATGYKKAGADLNTIFAALGTTGVQVGTQPSAVKGTAAAGNPSGTVTSGTTTCAGAKGGGTYTYTWHIASGSATLTAPTSVTTGVTATVDAGDTLTGSMYCTISDGVTSVNTNTVGWTLQNTTPEYLFSGSIVAGTYSNSPDINDIGYVTDEETGSVLAGSISPSTDTNGNVVGEVYTTRIGSSAPYTFNNVLGIRANVPQSYFTTLTIGTTALTSATAGYLAWDGYMTYWYWTGNLITASGQSYPVTYV